ncbi:hypothetical protein SPRG_19933 [Saprolegnia parasitica CBS 223.65]|uniref:Calpain catalytic domain-containing protein n=1 Tax=Saprolegnia parasitica (strain CBS 223.65) TaxID=695850 RepID=A0A067CRY7_SAPPC|nr:hypothetical protein SPRG_19933 [Saprolegnia parasitica CBS 223.65]KDO29567.1 hypothetical protein SPRG_19933 [Saprolegnia parasitica CBS 223.65]|eukprot:XP_012199777.1 hypothetical protein SPRG_19933 [Saprolegnia parasitica CBS 223.65]
MAPTKTTKTKPHGRTRLASDAAPPKPSLISTESLATAIARCKDEVAEIAAECRANNRVFRDIEFDIAGNEYDCLSSLTDLWDSTTPGGALRVRQIFKDPIFCDDGFDAGDIQQGTTGNCWFLAALASVCSVPRVIENICVARDEKVGVYGFIFFKDGEWQHVIIDDQLYVTHTDFDHAYESYIISDKAKYKELLRTGSQALFFGKSSSARETWLPLLEKAYTKLHGDYKSVEGGFTGEGIEDLTGGVSTKVLMTDILNYDRFWAEEFSRTNVDTLFSAYIIKKNSGLESRSDNGLVHLHAYSILKAVEVNGTRFLMIRNPWGQHEWNGRWSDGSKEWTPEWMAALDHKFGDDGAFWMQYEDFIEEFTEIDRTRLYDATWFVNQEWMEYRSAWPAAWDQRVFQFSLSTDGPANIVLAKADERYFHGLEGPFEYGLRMEVHKVGNGDDGETRSFVGRFVRNYYGRSISLEFPHLAAGTYDVDLMIVRTSTGNDSVQDVVSDVGAARPDKLLQICQNFNDSRAKAVNLNGAFDLLAFASGTQSTAYEQQIAHVAKINAKMQAKMQAAAEKAENDDGEEDEDDEEEEDDEDDGEDKLSGAVVIGLRIYTKDASATVVAFVENDVEAAEDDE